MITISRQYCVPVVLNEVFYFDVPLIRIDLNRFSMLCYCLPYRTTRPCFRNTISREIIQLMVSSLPRVSHQRIVVWNGSICFLTNISPDSTNTKSFSKRLQDEADKGSLNQSKQTSFLAFFIFQHMLPYKSNEGKLGLARIRHQDA